MEISVVTGNEADPAFPQAEQLSPFSAPTRAVGITGPCQGVDFGVRVRSVLDLDISLGAKAREVFPHSPPADDFK